ncbi:short-chain dehydrogenase [Crepidotus variabilis]|uniref:Short-chain dehydrogenase n=1 Tax=Crepidotus variabilis TaxID=179855 RepID=A0A9P6ESV9_9AGAR|nr:short-chain dehydrogenase [Crepidotus variabilis]
MKPVVIVTGASKGIGLAVTRYLLHKYNANVVAISRTKTPELDELASDSLMVVECDIADDKAFSDAISQGVSRYQTIDGLILNAATLDPLGRIGGDSSLDAWRKHFDVNFFSLVTAAKATLPYLQKSQNNGGRIVFVSSGAAVKGTAGWGPYNASKAAMNSLCRTLAEEAPDVVSLAVRPGMVDTNMQGTLRSTGGAHMNEKEHQFFIQAHLEGKLVKPEDCGHVIAALSVHASRSLSGQFVSWDSEECKPYRNE